MKRAMDYLNEFAKMTDIFYELDEDEKISLKKCLLEIFMDFAKVCEKYNLCYMLGGGSALGAVRHQGFIPWDDDLDVMMPREDYNKLIDVFEKELGEKYLFSVPSTGKESRFLFFLMVKKNTLMYFEESVVKDLNGIKIDIFPIENAPNNIIIRYCIALIADIFRFTILSVSFYKHRKLRLLEQALYMRSFKTKLYYYFRLTLGKIFSVFSRKYLYDKYDKFVSYSRGYKYCSIPTGRKQYRGETHARDVFFPVKKSMFEGITVNIPNKADIYLKGLYGENYMQIPPVEKRERHFYIKFSLDTTIQ